ncbi:Oligopeptide-binding protein AppA precursor,oligopeptide ABC transporter substrate-binding protein OppA,ABC-type oligopeptide transport system, periplasmic component,nickel ABC transporter, nickel/metallophore periplasmic binding protein,Bacterial extracellular solute-binding proteins, family 5 Middle [Chlamydia serpentis]|uniref:Solute-binding protein family 5 domain-containing protein n=2 Tax=Chlamydia serpentis TaxID=1967782 RepID=A0A2R8FBB8_9CHLA|nr:Oligopeptide-binding protein AppA precursor,oligopeptide ABC transporter substrate-binding protein OppA,ABC-type oligopeptide transport system, periplasmic component,nickel ABC transporter, nickel/metallophore periplasmic binding protein,Bacterial extracellular solute-binding proteins, family 5 Middle [Chlamydia serpentis]
MDKGCMLDKILKGVVVVSLILLYWSSDLLERDIKSIKGNVKDIQEDIREISRVVKQQSSQALPSVSSPTLSPSTVRDEALTILLGDPSYPNLLSTDPYKQQTLPELLGRNFNPHGILRTAHVGKPENLSPFNGFDYIVGFYDLCVPDLASPHVGKYETFSPDLALKIEEHLVGDGSGDKEFHIYLRPNVFWRPIDPKLFPKHVQLDEMFLRPHPVTAHDIKFFYDAVMNPYVATMRAVALRSYYEDIVSVSVENDSKLVVRWKAHTVINEEGEEERKVLYSAFFNTLSLKPLPRFVYQYFANGEKIIEDENNSDNYRTNSIWAQNFAIHWANNYIVSCGAYYFGGMDDEKIIFSRNPDFYDPHAALLEARYTYFKESSDSLFQDFKTGKIDISYLPPNQRDNFYSFMKSPAYNKQVAKGGAIREVVSSDRAYTYIGWNCYSLFFQSQQVRCAMNMAIDRERIIEQCLDGQGYTISGPFAYNSPSYNKQIEGWHYSPEEAARLLEEEGWIDTDGDGIREKIIDGVIIPFRFRLCYYVKSLTARTIADYVATSCKEIGIECSLLGLDMADLSQAFDEKNFDALLMGWCLGSPPEDPRALWHSEGAMEKGSANVVGFHHEEVDKIIDKLSYEYDAQERNRLYHRFHEIIHEEAPYAFLFSRHSSLLYKDYVKNVFVPLHRTDLIPEAQDETVNVQMVWLEKKEDQCLSTS